jgi:hypothetical protein
VTIDAIMKHAADAPSEESGITVICWHGPWCSAQRDDAFGFRRAGYEYWVHSFWSAGSDGSKDVEWVQGFFKDMSVFSTGAVYVNDLEEEGQSRVRAAYGSKFERLGNLKFKYDPSNLFRVNQNISPARPSEKN